MAVEMERERAVSFTIWIKIEENKAKETENESQ